MSDYKIISALNEEHKVYLVQSALSGNIYVQKILDVYNIRVYEYLYRNPVAGIPRLINYYEDGNQLIVIEEYISGTSLQEKIDNSDLSVSDIRSYMIMLCNILNALHSMTPPIIHRDIKPSNIIITSYNYAMLLDFNAAKQFSGQNESDTVLIGTPGYAAPEQYGFGSSSPKTDIYSLGIVLREMLGSITPVPNIAPILHRLNMIADRCTQMTPATRYQSVAELKNAVSQSYYPAQHSTSAAGSSAFSVGSCSTVSGSLVSISVVSGCTVSVGVFNSGVVVSTFVSGSFCPSELSFGISKPIKTITISQNHHFFHIS